MKLFISWSGKKSQNAATALKQWLPMFHTSIETFMSKEDIEKGSRWAVEVATELKTTEFGIIVLSKENLTAPWILFESGSLAKTFTEEGRLFTFLLDVSYDDVKAPLNQFQGTRFAKEDTFKMLSDMGKRMTADTRDDRQRQEHFDAIWSILENKLTAACKEGEHGAPPPPPKLEDLITELHADVKAQRRDLQSLATRVSELGLGRSGLSLIESGSLSAVSSAPTGFRDVDAAAAISLDPNTGKPK